MRWPFAWDGEAGHYWCRFTWGPWYFGNGPGVAIKDTRRHRLLFSERNGLKRQFWIGPWLITLLAPFRVEEPSNRKGPR